MLHGGETCASQSAGKLRGSPLPDPTMTPPSAPTAAAHRSATAGLATTLTAALLAACGGGQTPPPGTAAPAPSSAAPAATAAAAGTLYDPTLLLDWAEREHAAWFPGPQADREALGYVYRHYPATGNHLGVNGNDVAVLGPISGERLLRVGELADWECRVLPGRCGSPTLAERSAAAAAAARSDAACVAAQPFHWSLGDAGGRLAEGSVGPSAPTADTEMAIASASKWLYAAYVAERRAGSPSADDRSLLNFTSGWTGFDICLPQQTVAQCQSHQGPLIRNGGFDAAQVGRFNYSGGHMQQHAVRMGLGELGNAALAREVGGTLGLQMGYSQPQPAGGAVTTAAEYGRFLQRVTAGKLRIAALLGRDAVCTNPATCSTAVYSPVQGIYSWHYAWGHWIEDDPATGGDGSFSSAGAFGFYPWIDAGRRWWGIVARRAEGELGPNPDQRPARESAACGARIRAAWLAGRVSG